MSFEAVKITNVIKHTEEIISNNKENVDKRKLYDKIEKNKSTEINTSDKGGK